MVNYIRKDLLNGLSYNYSSWYRSIKKIDAKPLSNPMTFVLTKTKFKIHLRLSSFFVALVFWTPEATWDNRIIRREKKTFSISRIPQSRNPWFIIYHHHSCKERMTYTNHTIKKITKTMKYKFIGWTIITKQLFSLILYLFLYYVVEDTSRYLSSMDTEENKTKKQKINLNWWNNIKCLDRFIVHEFLLLFQLHYSTNLNLFKNRQK